MALPICYEAFIRLILVLIKKAYENWFYTLGLIVVLYYLGLKVFFPFFKIPHLIIALVVIFILSLTLGYLFTNTFCASVNSLLIWLQ